MAFSGLKSHVCLVYLGFLVNHEVLHAVPASLLRAHCKRCPVAEQLMAQSHLNVPLREPASSYTHIAFRQVVDFNVSAYFAQVTNASTHYVSCEEQGFQGGLWESNTNRAVLSHSADAAVHCTASPLCLDNCQV